MRGSLIAFFLTLRIKRCGAPGRAVLEAVEEGAGTDRIAIVIDGDLALLFSSYVPLEPRRLFHTNQIVV
jgi:hypothetical protein